jgi:hypothetical protein
MLLGGSQKKSGEERSTTSRPTTDEPKERGRAGIVRVHVCKTVRAGELEDWSKKRAGMSSYPARIITYRVYSPSSDSMPGGLNGR